MGRGRSQCMGSEISAAIAKNIIIHIKSKHIDDKLEIVQ